MSNYPSTAPIFETTPAAVNWGLRGGIVFEGTIDYPGDDIHGYVDAADTSCSILWGIDAEQAADLTIPASGTRARYGRIPREFLRPLTPAAVAMLEMVTPEKETL